ncbi:hypothetical protein J422_01328 [Methanocaldococcus villosus KIN24-T80]|uniref:Uncharacterized protein n=1 Tax=Methanocaldococcus villosus KIN24-T80 TaxID=1069083 RepID=N6VRW0_9EURY|nr:hypothetical protein [Methanocaldococcus villosus]ENN96600.1 hypothetical protein J422_01328 [Methanocaldococcus villosus KIN24-T80]
MKKIIVKNKKEFLNNAKEYGQEDEIYINLELDRDVAIALLENIDPKKIYLPESKYKRTSKKIIKALNGVGVEVIAVKPKTGRPTNIDEIIKKYLHLKPKEIAEKTGINLKTVEYHYYKLKRAVKCSDTKKD